MGGGRGRRASEHTEVRPEIRETTEGCCCCCCCSRYLSRKRITKRNIVEPYISDGALMKHSRSRHSEITRDRLDVLPGAGAPGKGGGGGGGGGGCSLSSPRIRGSDGVERIPAIFNENKRTPYERLILEPAGRLL